ncbi:hypothetical protein S40288_10833 [Stachybotrys chartarum IBT 40288]|nr:hypothetical protein S40288_10833 [Stachybotrys chartarum IBT 40288]
MDPSNSAQEAGATSETVQAVQASRDPSKVAKETMEPKIDKLWKYNQTRLGQPLGDDLKLGASYMPVMERQFQLWKEGKRGVGLPAGRYLLWKMVDHIYSQGDGNETYIPTMVRVKVAIEIGKRLNLGKGKRWSNLVEHLEEWCFEADPNLQPVLKMDDETEFCRLFQEMCQEQGADKKRRPIVGDYPATG